MKKFRFLGICLLAMTACVNFSSCSDDDDDRQGSTPSINQGRRLKAIYTDGNYPYYYFANAQWDGNKIISFMDGEDLSDESNRMSITYSGESAYINRYTIELNDKGFATKAYFGGYEYLYSYNENGQMTHWECQDPDYPNYNECCNIFYDGNGDITRIYPSYGDNKTFVYVNDSVTSPIENKGGIMLLSDWNIMGDWEYYYWFGIYGKATKHLPVKVGDNTYNWTLDKKGYPTSCKVETDEYVWTYCFEWE